VPLSHGERYVLADIPGLLPGAASGTGLGTRFLKHLNRTRLLLHVVDISQKDDLAAQAQLLREELSTYSAELGERESWLLANKCDLLSAEQAQSRTRELCHALQWEDPVFITSALTRQGLPPLHEAIVRWLSEQRVPAEERENTGKAQLFENGH
jgi:GTP-binding protein